MHIHQKSYKETEADREDESQRASERHGSDTTRRLRAPVVPICVCRIIFCTFVRAGGAMEPTPLEAAMRERAELRASRQKLKHDIGNARQKVKKAEQAANKCWVVAGPLLNTIVIIMHLAGPATEAAAKYLALEAIRRQWPDKRAEELDDTVANCYLDYPDGELLDLIDAGSPSDGPSFAKAYEWVEQWRLYRWTAELNTKNAVAPSTEFVLQRYERNIAQVPEQLRPQHRGGSAEPRARMWALRWRRRWEGKMGKIPVTEDVPVETMRDKAAPKHTVQDSKNGTRFGTIFRYHIWCHFSVPQLIPFHGTEKRHHIWYRNVAPNRVPFLGHWVVGFGNHCVM